MRFSCLFFKKIKSFENLEMPVWMENQSLLILLPITNATSVQTFWRAPPGKIKTALNRASPEDLEEIFGTIVDTVRKDVVLVFRCTHR